MNIQLVRYRQNPETIDGHLSIDGIRICDCAENAHTALPPGTYSITIAHCRQYARKMPVVVTPKGQMEQPGTPLGTLGTEPQDLLEQRFSAPGTAPLGLPLCSSCHRKPYIGINTKLPCVCPMLKPGNGAYHREDGSIIVGEYLVPGSLKHSKPAFDNLYERIRKNLERGNEVTLTIR